MVKDLELLRIVPQALPPSLIWTSAEKQQLSSLKEAP